MSMATPASSSLGAGITEKEVEKTCRRMSRQRLETGGTPMRIGTLGET